MISKVLLRTQNIHKLHKSTTMAPIKRFFGENKAGLNVDDSDSDFAPQQKLDLSEANDQEVLDHIDSVSYSNNLNLRF